MKDIFTLLEKLYAHKEYAVSRRFLPVVVVSVFAIVATVIGLGDIAPNPVFKTVALSLSIALIGVLWVSATLVLPHERRWLKHAKEMIEDCDFEEARRTLSSPPPLIGFAARIKRMEALVYLKMEIGDLFAAYSCLLDAEQRTLMPDERYSLQQVRATLMFKAGNYEAFVKVLGDLSSEISKSGLLRFRNALLNSHVHELRGQFPEAKALLEEANEIAPEPKLVAVAFNNLARLEDMQGNDTNAQSYYERAWQVLRVNPMPKLYPVVGHNLLIKYGRNSAVEKALNLLNEYRAMVLPSNTQQYLQFLNDQVHLARQLGNRAMLLETYECIERVLKPKTNKSELFARNVSELRMRFSDGLPVADQLVASIALLDENMDLTAENRIHVLRELLGVLKQCNARVDGKDFSDIQGRVITELLLMEVEIDLHLRDTPPVLPSIRDVWYGHKLEICKIKMGQSAPRFSRSDFDKMFNLLHQRQQVWADKGNPEGELDALMVICDEFVTYAGPLGPQFAIDYGTMAKQSLKNAAEVLAIHWPHPSVQRHALGVAYFYWQLENDKEGAELWLLRFEKLGLNPAHYAPWFRKWHTEVQGWLMSLKQARISVA
jgi:tetratricopeptide (TPR) repeat protein